MSPRLSVVIPSLNGASGLGCCLSALHAQTIGPDLEIIVVDDGSADATSDVARAAGAIVLRHASKRGAAAARNWGIGRATAPIVAFLDDDCEADPDWARTLLGSYQDDVVGLGGAIAVGSGRGFVLAYLARHNPLDPQELELSTSNKITYRFTLYLRRKWLARPPRGRRDVALLPTANFSARRAALLAIGGFDEQIGFGSEDDDLCRRLVRAFPAMRLVYDPDARVVHHFEPTLRDTLRRSRTYGRGSAIMHSKWPEVPPTFFPYPSLMLAVLGLSFAFPPLFALAALLPHVLYPKGLRIAVRERSPACLLDAYIELAQEASDNVGFVQGMWHFRNFKWGDPVSSIQPLGSEDA